MLPLFDIHIQRWKYETKSCFGRYFLFGLGIFYILLLVSGWRPVHIILRLSSYDKKIKALQKKEVERREKAAEYNKQVQTSAKTFTDPFSEKSNHQAYADALNLGDVMGYIEISKLI